MSSSQQHADHGFDYWWSLPGDWVEEPNQARKGWSGVLRATTDDGVFYIKRQRNYLCHTLRHPFGWPTASREWHYLQRLKALGINAPQPVFHGTRQTPAGLEAILVTAELTGYVALADLPPLDPAQRRNLAGVIGTLVGRLHQAGLQHSCLYDKHVMVRLDGSAPPAVALIDLEKMRPALIRARGSRRDMRQFKRRQAVFSDDDWHALAAAHEGAMKGA
jgi:hypothetical protein